MRLAFAILAAAVALLLAACGGGGGSGDGGAAQGGRPPAADEVRLVVSRDFGAEVLRDLVVPYRQKLDVLRLLAENAEVETAYGGGFVESVDGLKSSFGAVSSAEAADWFYWVDGVLADVGAADWPLRGGETVWWDYHRWADAMIVPMALHAFPRPYDGAPLAVTAAADVAGLDDWAAATGLELGARRDLASHEPDGGLVLVTAEEAAATPWVRELLSPARSGLRFADVGPGSITLLAPGGERGPAAAAVAQPVGNPDDPARPFLLVVGASRDDLAALLPRLTAETLAATVAVALVDDEVVRLPWLAP